MAGRNALGTEPMTVKQQGLGGHMLYRPLSFTRNLVYCLINSITSLNFVQDALG